MATNHSRRRLLQASLALGLPGVGAAASAKPLIEVWKSPYCGCCKDWVVHLMDNGYTVRTHEVGDLDGARRRLGMPERFASCHTARVGGYLLDSLFTMLVAIPAYGLLFGGIAVGTADMETYTDSAGVSHTTGEWDGAGTPLVILGAVLFLVPLAFFVWNTCVRQGRTGYSLGKGIVGIRLLGENSGQPIGGGMSFVRYLLHFLDSFACYLGWLWPLWDSKRQTFADKILRTVVVNQPK